jgi:fatty-acyl-CoA synthase
MSNGHPLDRFLRDAYPDLGDSRAVAELERVPYDERIAVESTYEALRIGASLDPDQPAIHFLLRGEPDEEPLTLTYRQYMGRVTQTANLLHDMGVGPRDVVSFMLPLLPQTYMVLFGAEAAGIVNPVNPMLEVGQIAEILRAAGTKVLVTLGPTPGSEIWEKSRQVRSLVPTLDKVLQVQGPGDERDGVYPFDALVDRYPADRLASGRRIEGGELAAYFHTGGTTGLPKLVRHTHRNQVSQAWGVNLIFHSEPRTAILCGLPLFHVGGALTQGLAPLTAGQQLVILTPVGYRNPAVIRNYWRLVERYRAAVVGAVPTVLAAVLNAPREGVDLSSVRYASGGGSGIPVEVGKAIETITRTSVLEVYGMTETSSVHTMSYPWREVRLGSVGHPLPYAKVRVVKLDGEGRYERDCAVDEIGVVAMSGPGVFAGYVSDQHNKTAWVEEGWVNSGDLGRLDAEGYLWITGRSKDVIIRGGHNIDPLPIEEILYQHPAVELAALVGQPDSYAGELPVAYVQLKRDRQAEPGELLEFVKERTPERAANPVNLYTINPMPLTPVGKVFKPELRWDAARRVFDDLVAPLREAGVKAEVQVQPDPVHGTLARVLLKATAGADRETIERKVTELFAPFVIRHRVEWS